jgi:hypothetical protein
MSTFNESILTLSFTSESGLGDITMQYHPSVLNMRDRTAARNFAGLNNIITYVPPKNTSDSAINISAYFTSLIHRKDDQGSLSSAQSDIVTGFLATEAAIIAGAAGGRNALDFLDAAASSISLAKGVYNIATSVISRDVISPVPKFSSLRDHIKKIADLHEAMDKSVPCWVVWDVVLAVREEQYIINAMNVDVERIREENGDSMILKVDLSLIRLGAKVEVM